VGGEEQAQATLPTFVGQQAIEAFQMVSPTEGWMMITGGRDQHDNILSSQVYHLLNGSWSLVTLPDQSQYQNVVFDGAFGPDEAWIEGDTNAIAGATPPTPHLFLYRNGTVTPMTVPMPPGDNAWDSTINMQTPQDGWLVVGKQIEALNWLDRTLLHFDGTTWSQTSVLDDPRVQTAAKVVIFSADEGMAFLTSPLPHNIAGGETYPAITQALWLHNGQWQRVSWPSNIWGIGQVVQVSPTEYWAMPMAVGSSPQSAPSAILHFDDGVWTSYS
jgi:hypothetical protein